MADGDQLIGQHLITKSDHGPVERLWYVAQERADATIIHPQADDRALVAIADADLIAYSIGSFWTSIVSTLQINGYAAAIRAAQAPKVLLTNAYEDKETVGMTVGDMVNTTLQILRENDSQRAGNDNAYLDAVISNTLRPSPSTRRFVKFDRARIVREHPQVEVYGEKLLGPKLPGTEHRYYDPQKMAFALFSFLPPTSQVNI